MQARLLSLGPALTSHAQAMLLAAGPLLTLAGCTKVAGPPISISSTNPMPSSPPLPDSTTEAPEEPDWQRATKPHNIPLTRAAHIHLIDQLRDLANRPGFALGHQDTTAYGVGWREQTDRSDVKSVCGAHVAVYGWDLFRIERGAKKNGDGVNFHHLAQLAKNAHEAGGINTISWHVDNPLTGGDAWDTTPAVSAALPGGSHHTIYLSFLNRLADYLDSLRGEQNERIPVILRLFHEQNGTWFWWGRQNQENDLRRLLAFSINHLRTARGLDHLLFALSNDGGPVRTKEDLLYAYPGDEYIDVLGFDYYLDPGQNRIQQLAAWLTSLADEHQLTAAITEFGPRNGIGQASVEANFLSRHIVTPLAQNRETRRLAYLLAWRNDRPEHAFLPYPGHPSAPDLKAVCERPDVYLTGDLLAPALP